MKILMIAGNSKASGIFTYTEAVTGELRRKGISVELNNGTGGKYDLIHVQNCSPEKFLPAIVQNFGTPIITTTQMTERELAGLVPNALARSARHYLNFVYRCSDKIICCSEAVKSELEPKERIARKLLYLPHPVDLKRFHPDGKLGTEFRKKYAIPKNRKIVLCVGTLQQRKGIFEFCRLARLLPQYQFVWVGNIPQVFTLKRKEEIERIMADKKSGILFTGFLSGKELLSALNSADLFIFPSHSETFGLAIIEAAACGLPVLLRELPVFNMFGFAEKFRSEDEMLKKTVKILENPSLNRQLRKKSLRIAREFSLENHAERLIGIYKQTLSQKKPVFGIYLDSWMKNMDELRARISGGRQQFSTYIEKMDSYFRDVK